MKVCPKCHKQWPDASLFCGDDATPLPSPETEGLTGRVIGRYRVLDRLGGGGMGTVYIAEHMKLKRKDAIKVLNSTWADQGDALARFHREARNASTITHPNVCAVYDFGETPEGLTFLAMELVDGKSLAEILEEEGALAPARAARLTLQVADALTAAHDKGIVHRDLKPGNIMVTRGADGREVVKVVDFGIAKAAGGLADQEVTRVGLVAGTPEYMSPEHLRGDEPDPRSDVYSLGVVFYRMLTGRLPFGQGHSGVKPLELAKARPEGDFPSGVQSVIERALEYDPLNRFQSAMELGRAAVSATQEELPATQLGRVPSDSSRPPAWRSPKVIAGGLGLAAVVVVVAVMFSGGSGGAALSVDPAVGQLRAGNSQTLTLRAGAGPAEGSTWRSSDPQVVEVDAATGILTARRIGSATIWGFAQGDSVQVVVQVLPGAPSRVAFSRDGLELPRGERTTVVASVFDGYDNPVGDAVPVLSVENPRIATMDASGTVSAVAPGRTRVIASVAADGGEVSDTLLVTVSASASATPTTGVPAQNPTATVTQPATEAPSASGGVTPSSAAETLRRIFTGVPGADRATAMAYRDTASAYWDLGTQLDSGNRGLAAFVAGQASDLLGEAATARTWWCRAESLGFDTRRPDLECS